MELSSRRHKRRNSNEKYRHYRRVSATDREFLKVVFLLESSACCRLFHKQWSQMGLRDNLHMRRVVNPSPLKFSSFCFFVLELPRFNDSPPVCLFLWRFLDFKIQSKLSTTTTSDFWRKWLWLGLVADKNEISLAATLKRKKLFS